MPDLGRWFGVDKLAESYLSTSPYAYVMNNPIMMYDPDGRSGNWWDNVWTDAGNNGTTTYTNFDSNGNWGSSTFSPFAQQGTATAFYNFLSSGQTGSFTYWTGGAGSTTGSYNSSGMDVSMQGVVANKIYIKGSQDSSWDGFKDWTDKSATTMEGMFQFAADQRTSLYNRGYWMDNLGNQRSVRYAGRGNSLIGLRSDYVRTTAKFGKYAERAGMVGNVIAAGEITYGVYEDGWKYGKNAKIATAIAVSGFVGAAEGALIGAYLGTFIPVPGAGTILGLVLGAGVGYIYGEIAEKAAEHIYENK